MRTDIIFLMTIDNPAPQETFISVIIPAYNEESNLGRTLEEVSQYLTGRYRHEIIVVDDGSRDMTGAIAEAFALRAGNVRVERNPINRGKGYSIRRGVAVAAGTLCLFMDADMAVPISELDRFITHMGDFDIVIASRFLEGSIVTGGGQIKKCSSRTFNRMVKTLFGLGFSDTQCGFKLIRTELAKRVLARCRINRFSYDVELLYFAGKTGASILEAPVTCRNSPFSKLRFFRDPPMMFLDVLKLKMRTILYGSA